jgi:D-amino-acid dehydrogenase
VSAGRSVVVVGGGVIGMATAYYALRKGHRVTVVERGGPDHDGCSLGNAGMVTPSHFVPLAAPGMVAMGIKMMFRPTSPFTIRPRLDADLWRWGWRFYRSATAEHVERSAPFLRDLALQSRRLFEEMAEASGNEFGLVKKGLLMLCRTEETFREEVHTAEMAHRLGMPAEVMTPEEAHRLEPALRMDIRGAVYFPQDCHLVPQKFMAWLTGEVERQGGKVLWSTEVGGFEARNGRVESVRTSAGALSADEYVIAAGSWSARLARGVGLDLPLQAGKGYSVTLPAPRRLPAICSILTEARVAVTPMASSLRFAGTLEVAGLDRSVNPSRLRGLLESIPRYFPELGPSDLEGLPVWSGLRPCSPDGLPYVGRAPRLSNLSIACGHAMQGLSQGPITGKLLAEVLSGEKPSLDLSLLRPDRFAR